MKLLHLGDLHLGKNVNGFSMISDQRYILEQILDIVNRQEIDAILIAGDIYDKSVPSEEAVALFDEFLTRVSNQDKCVIAISGNHDSDERLHYGSRLFEANHIYITGKYTGNVPCVTLEDAYGPVHIWSMPYVKASLVRHYFDKDDTSTYDAAFRTVIQHMDLNPSERNVMIAHQFVIAGANDPELAGSEQAVLNVGTVDKIHSDCLDDFDYVALGHIHSGQSVGREACRYSGSPLKYSLSEISHVKSAPIITLGKKGKIDIEFVELKPLRDMRRLKGRLSDLLAKENICDTQDYIYVTLTDETTQYDAMARIQEIYPNTMKLDYENSHTRKLQEDDGIFDTGNKSFHEMMSDFYQLINGGEPTEEEWEILNDVAREAGVLE